MTLTFTAGATNLPLPRAENPVEMEYMPLGVSQRTVDGTLRNQLSALKYRARVHWHGLSAAERATLFTVFANGLTTAALWTFMDGASFTAHTVMGSWAENGWYQPHAARWYYSVNFVIEQV